MTRVLVVDNYDSFTYNLVQMLGALGADLIVRRNDTVSPADLADLAPDAVVISPGPCTPGEAGASVDIIRAAAPRVPVLGVCLGHQAIGAAFGGLVTRAPRPVHGKASPIHHDGRGLLAGLPSPFPAGRYHSLIVDQASLPEELEVCAWTEDGLVMALRHRRYPTWGLQFHPESVLTPHGETMLERFLNLAREERS